MSLIRWNPYREFATLREMMDRLAGREFGWSDQDSGPRVAQLPVDVTETDNEFVVTASVAGVNPDEVEIAVEGDTLTIRGEIPARPENVEYVYAERYHGPFARRLTLNVPVDVNHIEATFEDGLLTLVLPKSEEARTKVIKVTARK